MPEKTKEEYEKERAEAAKQLEALMHMNAPKNLGEGVTTGVGNIIQGAVGAAGVAVLLPTMGLAVGARQVCLCVGCACAEEACEVLTVRAGLGSFTAVFPEASRTHK